MRSAHRRQKQTQRAAAPKMKIKRMITSLKNDIESVLKDEELQPLFEKLRNKSLYDGYNKFIKKMSEYKINTEPTDPIVDDTISIVH